MTLNVQAERAMIEWRATPDTIRVDMRACYVDPMNRGATLMNGERVHETNCVGDDHDEGCGGAAKSEDGDEVRIR